MLIENVLDCLEISFNVDNFFEDLEEISEDHIRMLIEKKSENKKMMVKISKNRPFGGFICRPSL